MQILLTGGSGLIGRRLCLELWKQGHQLTLVTRQKVDLSSSLGFPVKTLVWDPSREPCPESLEAFDAVIHLMGESLVKGRWTKQQKQLHEASRVQASLNLGQAIAKRQKPLALLIAASAIGYYGPDTLSQPGKGEGAAAGQGYLASLAQKWEQAIEQIPAQRRVLMRLGVVLAHDGGFFAALRPVFSLRLGAILGKREQILSWIHREDVIAFIQLALQESKIKGIYNLVSPKASPQGEWASQLASLFQGRLIPGPPTALIYWLLGEKASMILESQHILPERLMAEAFPFRYPDIGSALKECARVAIDGKPSQVLETQHWFAQSREDIFPFFANPYNLEKITPPFLHFRIKSLSQPEIAAAVLINYQLRIRGLPQRWQTLIKEWRPNEEFVDLQLKGPYELWHHRHRFESVAGGTLMSDEVHYRLPFGALAEFLALPLVLRDIQKIFAYRRSVLARGLGDIRSQ